MKVTALETLACDAGWRNYHFARLTTSDGIVGWSEFSEDFGSPGITAVIRRLAGKVIGQQVSDHERIYAELYAATRPAAGGVVAQAMAAIENALLDVKAKSLGVPVYELFGGKVRERLPLYWSHCGSYRFRNADVMKVEPVRSLDDLVKLGKHVKERGFKALKTNIFRFDLDPPNMYQPGFGRTPGGPELNADGATLAAIRDGLAAFRQGAGPDMGILLDTNFNFKTEGYIKVARACELYNLFWLEIDSYDPEGLRLIRDRAPMPIASCESLFSRRQFRPFFENRSIDVSIIDVPWNGLAEGYKISTMAEAYEINCAPHNFYGHMSTLMSANLCAAMPNFRIMEIDIDDVPWKDDLVTHPPVIQNGELIVPNRPGWGADINEEAVKAHPPKNPHP